MGLGFDITAAVTVTSESDFQSFLAENIYELQPYCNPRVAQDLPQSAGSLYYNS